MVKTVIAVALAIGALGTRLDLAASPQSPSPPSLTATMVGEPNVRLDVRNFCCPDYIALLRRSVAANWNARQGIVGTTTVKFVIERNGQISGAEIERSSGFAVLDVEAVRAVRAAKLPPLPAAFDQATLTLHLTFAYERARAPSSAAPTSPAPSPDLKSPAPGQLGEALRNLERYVKDGNNFPQPEPGADGVVSPGAQVEFDTQGVEFGPWLRQFIAQVRRNWVVPSAAQTLKGRSVVRFTVSKAGAIRNVSVVQPSGVAEFDRAALNAITGANPLPPLPPEYPKDEALFTVNFYYYNEQPAKP